MATENSDLMIRLSLASVGVWWWGFSVYTFRDVPEPEIPEPVTGLNARTATGMAFRELRKTFKELTRFKMLAIYLAAYLMFNDGIQTVLSIAGAFGGVAAGPENDGVAAEGRCTSPPNFIRTTITTKPTFSTTKPAFTSIMV